MFEYANDKQVISNTQPRTVTDVVCPIHFKPLPYPQVLTEGTDEKTGLIIRTYFGWCFECNRGFAVIQSKRGERWVIYKYQIYSAGVLISNRDTDWIILNEPQRPPEQKDGEAAVMDSVREMHKAMKSCCSTIELLLRSMAEKRGQSIDD